MKNSYLSVGAFSLSNYGVLGCSLSNKTHSIKCITASGTSAEKDLKRLFAQKKL